MAKTEKIKNIKPAVGFCFRRVVCFQLSMQTVTIQKSYSCGNISQFCGILSRKIFPWRYSSLFKYSFSVPPSILIYASFAVQFLRKPACLPLISFCSSVDRRESMFAYFLSPNNSISTPTGLLQSAITAFCLLWLMEK